MIRFGIPLIGMGWGLERSRLAPNAELGETCAATTPALGIVVFKRGLRRNYVSPSSHPLVGGHKISLLLLPWVRLRDRKSAVEGSGECPCGKVKVPLTHCATVPERFSTAPVENRVCPWLPERGLPRRMKRLTRRRQKADGTMPRGLRDDGRGRGRARRWSRTAKSVFSDSEVRCQFSKVPIHFDVSHDSHFKSQVSQRRLRRGYYGIQSSFYESASGLL